MKSRVVSLLSTLLIAALMLGAVSCSGTTTSSAASSGNASSTALSSQAEASKYPSYLNLDSAYPAVKADSGEKITLSLLTTRTNASGEVPIDKVFFFRYLSDIMNVSFELEEAMDLDTRRSLMFATGDIPDIVWGSMNITPTELVTYGQEEGLLLAWDDYMTEELMPNTCEAKKEYSDSFLQCVLPNGKTYAFPRITNRTYYGSTGGLSLYMRTYINQKWLDACDLKVPTTLDDFVNMLITFQEEDPMGVGDNRVAMLANADMDKRYIWMALGFYSNTVSNPFTFGIKDGEAQLLCYTKEFKEYLSIFNKLYDAGAISKDYFTMDTTAVRGLMSSQISGVMCDYTLAATQANTYADWVSAAPLTSSFCATPVASINSITTRNALYASAKTKYPEVIARIADYMWTDEANLMYYNGPMADTELAKQYDVDGWYVDEQTGNLTTKSIVSGKYSAYDFYVGDVIYGSMYPCGNCVNSKKLAYAYAKYTDTHKYQAGTITDAITGDKYDFDIDTEFDNTTAGGWWQYTTTMAWKDNVTAISLPTVYMTSEETASVTDLSTVLSDYVTQETAKFIVGTRSLDEFDAFMSELKNLGIEDYIKTYTDAYATYMNATFGK